MSKWIPTDQQLDDTIKVLDLFEDKAKGKANRMALQVSADIVKHGGPVITAMMEKQKTKEQETG